MRSNECPCINEGSFRRCSMENSAICGDRGRVFTEGNARWVECRLILTFDRNMTREFGKALSVHRVTTSPFNPFALFSSRATALVSFYSPVHAVSVLNWIDRRVIINKYLTVKLSSLLPAHPPFCEYAFYLLYRIRNRNFNETRAIIDRAKMEY